MTTEQLKELAVITNKASIGMEYNHMPLSLFSDLGTICQWCRQPKEQWKAGVPCPDRPEFPTMADVEKLVSELQF